MSNLNNNNKSKKVIKKKANKNLAKRKVNKFVRKPIKKGKEKIINNEDSNGNLLYYFLLNNIEIKLSSIALLIYIIVNILFIIIGSSCLKSYNKDILRCTEQTNGIVIDMKEEEYKRRNGITRIEYTPIIRYKFKAEEVDVEYYMDSEREDLLPYQIGDKLIIKYNPYNALEFIIEGDENPTSNYYLFIGLGIIGLMLSLAIYLRKKGF